MSAAPDYSTPDPGDPVALERDFADLGGLLVRLNEDSMHRLDQADDDLAALELLFDLREARQKLAEIEASVEAVAAQRMAAPKVEWPGFVAERKGGADRKSWEHDRLAWAVVHPLCVDVNGETDDTAAALVAQVRDRLLNCAAVSYWRVTQLRQLGLNPSDYCSTTTGRRTVHVQRVVAG